MRWLLDALGLAMAVALLYGVIAFQRHQDDGVADGVRAASERRRVELEIRFRAAGRVGALNGRGWPTTIEPKWFEGTPPRNRLLPPESPWVEIATPEQAGLQDPPVRMAVNDKLAGYWYNPYLGVIKARVPVMVSDREAVELYNRINGTRLSSIFQTEVPEDSMTAELAVRRDGEPESLDPTLPRGDAEGEGDIEITPTGQIRRRPN